MGVNEIYDEIIEFCRTNSDEAKVKKYLRYFTEGYDAPGLIILYATEKMTKEEREKF
jgi:hypothetical protein